MTVEGLLVSLFYFLRPIAGMDVLEFQIAGFNQFELLSIVMTMLIGLAAIGSALIGNKPKPVSSVEWLLIAFIVWTSAVALGYYEDSELSTYAKYVLPPATYLILKRVIRDRQHYLRLALLLITGFAIPVVWSAVKIFHGEGLSQVDWKTGVERYEGVYGGIHNLGHSMGYVIMVMAIYIAILKAKVINYRGSSPVSLQPLPRKRLPPLLVFFFVGLGLLAFYALLASRVRTVYVGLFVFAIIALYFYSRKALVFFSMAIVAAGIGLAPYLNKVFYDVTSAAEGKADLERAGSGRPLIWKLKLTQYAENFPIDRKIAGGYLKIAHVSSTSTKLFWANPGWNSHNEYIDVLMRTGAVGLILLLASYVAFYKLIMRRDTSDKYIFLAFLSAVILMNFLSNSYISRFALGQLFFMVMVYLEMPHRSIKSVQTNPSYRPQPAWNT